MDEEFAGASGNPGEVAEQSPSQGQPEVAADSVSQAQKPAKVDLTELPEYRQIQSERDRREAALNKRIDEFERRLALKDQEAQMYRKVLSEAGDDDIATRLAREAELLELRSKAAEADQIRAQLEAQARVEEWKQGKRNVLRNLGMEVTPEFEGALTRATTTGDDTPVLEYIARQSQTKQAPPPVQNEQPKTAYTLPPGGGASEKGGNVIQRAERERYETLIAGARRSGNSGEVARLRAEMRSKGLL